MASSSKFVALLVGASLTVACGGVYVGRKAVAQTEHYIAEALRWKGQADQAKASISVLKGRLADAEKRIAEAQKGRPAPQVGTPGTLSRAARNYVNVKAPHDHYWRGQLGRDRHGHAVFASPEWSLRAGAIVLRNYAKRHNIHSVRGIVERFSTCNHDEYAAFLAKRLGVGENERIDIVKRMPELLPAMVRFETGRSVAPEHVAILDFLKES